jgi:hypothetical protein
MSVNKLQGRARNISAGSLNIAIVAARVIVLVITAVLIIAPFGAGEAEALSTLTLKCAPDPSVSADSVTVIGDSVTIGAERFADMESRIAKMKGISWCRVDARGSRQLEAGIQLARKLRKKGKLGSIVVYSLTTNSSFGYKAAKKARKAVGKGRYVVFVTGYNKGYTYPERSNDSIKKLAGNYKDVFVADWNKTIRKHKGKSLSDNRCHLTSKSGRWYTDTVIKAVKKAQKSRKDAKKREMEDESKLSAMDSIRMASGDRCNAPGGIWGVYTGNPELRWTSSDAGVVSVDADGKLSALGAGSAVISLTKPEKPKQAVQISVTVTNGKIDATAMAVGAKRIKPWASQLTVTPDRYDATAVPAFRSENKKIATVSRSGVVVGRAAGKTRIRVSLGNVTEWVNLSVK